MPAKKQRELKAHELIAPIDFGPLKVNSTNDAKPCCKIIGQDRAVKAIHLGLKIRRRGYNIFVTGLSGTGRSTTIKQLLEDLDSNTPHLNDVCYVNNFKDPDCPIAIVFEAGQGRQFKKDVEYVIESLRKVIPKILGGQDYKNRRVRIAADFEGRQKDIFAAFEKKMKDAGFVMVQLQVGMSVRNELQPMIDGEPMDMARLEHLVQEKRFSEERFRELEGKREKLVNDMNLVEVESKKLAEKLDDALSKLDYSMISPQINDKFAVLKKKYPQKDVKDYLTASEDAMLGDLDRFKESRPRRGEEEAPAFRKKEPFEEFAVNLILDNSGNKKVPVVVENSPSYRNIFGTMERVVDRFGYWRTDFSRIKGGSLLAASGGFLIINALDLFTEPGVWKPLKRTLMSEKLEIAGYDPFYQMAGSGLKPMPINVDVKVVLIGDRRTYSILWNYEEDFKKIFKVKAEFDHVMPLTKASLKEYVSFVRKIVDDDKLLPFDVSGLREIAAHGIRLAGRKDKLSTQFTIIADLIRESVIVAADEKKKIVNSSHVLKAIANRRNRVNLIEDKIQELYDNEIYLVQTSGKAVGQINGLSVYNVGEHTFGRPVRITARASVGRAGVINIEREADLSGPVHNKGVLVLSGFLRGKFAQNKPLIMSASICFEQSYSGVDGDSASSTEIYAILSTLSGVPIDQGIAVTGSVNQFGEIQPIGGVNEKIEGFFDVCKNKRLTGRQGVIIPHQNVDELQLRSDVVEAVEKGKFHIYPVKVVEEGIEILTGKPAGKALKSGGFTKGSVYDLADRELDRLGRQFKTIVEEPNGKNEKTDGEEKKKKKL
jgi:ATP-dependent Lon protease